MLVLCALTLSRLGQFHEENLDGTSAVLSYTRMSEHPECGLELQIALMWLELAARSLTLSWGVNGKEDPHVFDSF